MQQTDNILLVLKLNLLATFSVNLSNLGTGSISVTPSYAGVARVQSQLTLKLLAISFF